MCIAAGVLGVIGAGLGAAGTAYAGYEAASATRDAANTAAGIQNQALQQQAALAAPYTGLGQAAMPTYQALLGIGGPGGPNPQQIQSTLANLPGYQFSKQQGTDATEAALAAMGLGRSGNTIQAIDQFTTGLADTNYQQYLNDLLQPIQIGQAAAAGQAANIGNAATNMSNIAIGKGSALAGIDANVAAGLTKAIGGGAENYMLNQTLGNLNNPGSPWNPQNYGAPAGWYTGGQTGGMTYGQEVAAGF